MLIKKYRIPFKSNALTKYHKEIVMVFKKELYQYILKLYHVNSIIFYKYFQECLLPLYDLDLIYDLTIEEIKLVESVNFLTKDPKRIAEFYVLILMKELYGAKTFKSCTWESNLHLTWKIGRLIYYSFYFKTYEQKAEFMTKILDTILDNELLVYNLPFLGSLSFTDLSKIYDKNRENKFTALYKNLPIVHMGIPLEAPIYKTYSLKFKYILRYIYGNNITLKTNKINIST